MQFKKFGFRYTSYILVQALLVCLNYGYIEAAEERGVLSPTLKIDKQVVQEYFTSKTRQHPEIVLLPKNKKSSTTQERRAKRILEAVIRAVPKKYRIPKKIELIVKKNAPFYNGRMKLNKQGNVLMLLREATLQEYNDSQLAKLIGHELAHWLLGHMSWKSKEQRIVAVPSIGAPVLGSLLITAYLVLERIPMWLWLIPVGLTCLAYYLGDILKEKPADVLGNALAERAELLQADDELNSKEEDKAQQASSPKIPLPAIFSAGIGVVWALTLFMVIGYIQITTGRFSISDIPFLMWVAPQFFLLIAILIKALFGYEKVDKKQLLDEGENPVVISDIQGNKEKISQKESLLEKKPR
ncbi:MAG: M48 family metalloprotease [Candidatus Omnitrophica bacterium]|nr:M48 family metalloprotease [Candidatus Omnitrophota bacterium]MCK5590489.1 M48 family metalloprotease [Candidatus Paceibacterota bacterium]